MLRRLSQFARRGVRAPGAASGDEQRQHRRDPLRRAAEDIAALDHGSRARRRDEELTPGRRSAEARRQADDENRGRGRGARSTPSCRQHREDQVTIEGWRAADGAPRQPALHPPAGPSGRATREQRRLRSPLATLWSDWNAMHVHTRTPTDSSCAQRSPPQHHQSLPPSSARPRVRRGRQSARRPGRRPPRLAVPGHSSTGRPPLAARHSLRRPEPHSFRPDSCTRRCSAQVPSRLARPRRRQRNLGSVRSPGATGRGSPTSVSPRAQDPAGVPVALSMRGVAPTWQLERWVEAAQSRPLAERRLDAAGCALKRRDHARSAADRDGPRGARGRRGNRRGRPQPPALASPRALARQAVRPSPHQRTPRWPRASGRARRWTRLYSASESAERSSSSSSAARPQRGPHVAALALRYSGGLEDPRPVALRGSARSRSCAAGRSTARAPRTSSAISSAQRSPAEEDTPERFADAAAQRGGQREATRRARRVRPAVGPARRARDGGWHGLATAIWWLHAHTMDPSWTVDAEIRDAWAAEVPERTPLSSAELVDGAVDVEWFLGSLITRLGAARWKTVDGGGEVLLRPAVATSAPQLSPTRCSTAVTDAGVPCAAHRLRSATRTPCARSGSCRCQVLRAGRRDCSHALRASQELSAPEPSVRLTAAAEREATPPRSGLRISPAGRLPRSAPARLGDGGARALRISSTARWHRCRRRRRRSSSPSMPIGVPDLDRLPPRPQGAQGRAGEAAQPRGGEGPARSRDRAAPSELARPRLARADAMIRGDTFSGRELHELSRHLVLLSQAASGSCLLGDGTAGFPAPTAVMPSSTTAAPTHAIGTTRSVRIAHPLDLLDIG